jgi:hypothetical protein
MNVPLPDLRIVSLDSVLPHEEHDEQRLHRLVARIREDDVLRNPPIVTPIGLDDPRMVVLDGANRALALKRLGLSCVLVQVVHYNTEMVKLETWAHVVSGISTLALIDVINDLDEIELVSAEPEEAKRLLARREAILSLIIAAGTYVVHGGSDLHEQNTRLLRVVNAYQAHGTLNRTTVKTIEEARPLYPNGAGLIVFPNYQPAEVIAAARESTHIPPGITRHVIIGRALRVNYPLEELNQYDEDGSLEMKNARLTAWLQDRAANQRLRFYAEPTFLFDE